MSRTVLKKTLLKINTEPDQTNISKLGPCNEAGLEYEQRSLDIHTFKAVEAVWYMHILVFLGKYMFTLLRLPMKYDLFSQDQDISIFVVKVVKLKIISQFLSDQGAVVVKIGDRVSKKRKDQYLHEVS